MTHPSTSAGSPVDTSTTCSDLVEYLSQIEHVTNFKYGRSCIHEDQIFTWTSRFRTRLWPRQKFFVPDETRDFDPYIFKLNGHLFDITQIPWQPNPLHIVQTPIRKLKTPLTTQPPIPIQKDSPGLPQFIPHYPHVVVTPHCAFFARLYFNRIYFHLVRRLPLEQGNKYQSLFIR